MYIVDNIINDESDVINLVNKLKNISENIVVITNLKTFDMLINYLDENKITLNKIFILCEPCAYNDINLFEINILEKRLEEQKFIIR